MASPSPDLISTIEAAWRDGCPVASDAQRVGAIALRRWHSQDRRGVDPSDPSARISDLTNGLIQQLETNPARVGPLKRDYEHLASLILPVLAADSD